LVQVLIILVSPVLRDTIELQGGDVLRFSAVFFEGTGISLSSLDDSGSGGCACEALPSVSARGPREHCSVDRVQHHPPHRGGNGPADHVARGRLGVVSYQNMRSHIRKTIDATLQNDADQIAFHVERLLHAITRTPRALQATTASQRPPGYCGPEQLPGPFFLSYQLPEQVSFRIALCDLKGEFLAGNAQRSSYASLRDKALVQQVSRKGLPLPRCFLTSVMLPPDRAPVRPSASMGPQGMLVMDILLDDIFSRAWREKSAASMNVSFRCCDARSGSKRPLGEETS